MVFTVLDRHADLVDHAVIAGAGPCAASIPRPAGAAAIARFDAGFGFVGARWVAIAGQAAGLGRSAWIPSIVITLTLGGGLMPR